MDGSGEGQRLLDTLAEVTGTEVFGSTDNTGAGGDWVLEAASTGDQAELEAGLDTQLDEAAIAAYEYALADYNETAWSGTQTYTDGAISFTLSVTGGGTIDWSYDGTTDTLTISDNDGTSFATSLTITDNNGGLIVNSITLDTNIGSLVSDVDITTITVNADLAIDNITINGGSGTIGTLDFNGDVIGTNIIVNADVTTFDLERVRDTTVTVNGDVGAITINDRLRDATMHVTGDLASIYVNLYDNTFDVTVDHVIGQFDMTGAHSYSNNFVSTTQYVYDGSDTTNTVSKPARSKTGPRRSHGCRERTN